MSVKFLVVDGVGIDAHVYYACAESKVALMRWILFKEDILHLDQFLSMLLTWLRSHSNTRMPNSYTRIADDIYSNQDLRSLTDDEIRAVWTYMYTPCKGNQWGMPPYECQYYDIYLHETIPEYNCTKK